LPSPPKKRPAVGHHKLRIIGGRWRSRSLSFPAVEGLRPSGDRIRETLFNWLAPILPGSRCLDLFAGSGILGFEALSRGAAHCSLVELNPVAAQQLRANADQLQAQNAVIHRTSALEFLARPVTEPFDVVFIDPPFADNLWQPVMTLLDAGWLQEDALIYVEAPPELCLDLSPAWQIHREKRAGQVCYRLYRYETNSGARV
jgi:16S rRNA (guanine966-N2)-methyltransferase